VICFRDADGPEFQVMEYQEVLTEQQSSAQQETQQVSDEEAYKRWMQQGNNSQQ
jgi:hypothetical protein